MEGVDDLILSVITNSFKTVREISEELDLAYTRVSVRIKGLRKQKSVVAIQSCAKGCVGVKPLMYKKSSKIN